MKSKGRHPRHTRRAPERELVPERPTPIYVSRRALVIGGIVGIVALAVILYAAPSILTIAFGGLTLALVLSYPVRALSRVMPRELAILLTVLSLFGLIALAFVFLVPMLTRQLTNFLQVAPQIADSVNNLVRASGEFLERVDLPVTIPDDFVTNLIDGLFGRVQAVAQGLISGFFGLVSSAFNLAVILFGVLFVGIYLLADVRKAKALYLRTTPRRYRSDALALWEALGISLSRYLGGLLFIIVIQGVLSGVSLYLLSVPYFILLGLWVSLTAIIPYLGAFLGAIPAIVIALLFTSPTTAVLVVIVYIAIQQLEGNFLTPRIQGRAVRVHPIVVLLVVVGGGQIAGLAGVVFAVPALACAKVLIDFLRVRLKSTPLEETKEGSRRR